MLANILGIVPRARTISSSKDAVTSLRSLHLTETMGTGMGAGGGGRFTVAVEAAASNIFQALIHLCIIIIELSVSNSICNLGQFNMP